MNIGKGLGYLAVAALSIAIAYFTKEAFNAGIVAIVGLDIIAES